MSPTASEVQGNRIVIQGEFITITPVGGSGKTMPRVRYVKYDADHNPVDAIEQVFAEDISHWRERLRQWLSQFDRKTPVINPFFEGSLEDYQEMTVGSLIG